MDLFTQLRDIMTIRLQLQHHIDDAQHTGLCRIEECESRYVLFFLHDGCQDIAHHLLRKARFSGTGLSGNDHMFPQLQLLQEDHTILHRMIDMSAFDPGRKFFLLQCPLADLKFVYPFQDLKILLIVEGRDLKQVHQFVSCQFGKFISIPIDRSKLLFSCCQVDDRIRDLQDLVSLVSRLSGYLDHHLHIDIRTHAS